MENVKKYTFSSTIVRFCIAFLAIFLSWKLFRFTGGGKVLWLLHLYALTALIGVSLLLFFHNSKFFLASKTSMLVFVFLVFVLLRCTVFTIVDPFTIATATFGLYFLFYAIFSSVRDSVFFSHFEFLLKLLLAINLIDFIDGNFIKAGIFPYENIPNYFGELNPTIYETKSFVSELGILPIVRRTIGIAGTPYASSALVAATGIYFLLVKKRMLFWGCVIFLFAWGVGSTFLVIVSVALFTGLKKRYIPITLLVIVPMVIIAIDVRGVDPSVLFGFKNNFLAHKLLLAGFLGEGRQISSMASELRIVGTIFSLGLVGVILLCMVMYNYFRWMQSNKDCLYYNNYKAGFFFIITLLLSSLHYDAFFIFPNIVLVVILVAYSSSRTRFRIKNSRSINNRASS